MGYTWGETERGYDKRPNRIEGMPVGMQANVAAMRHHGVRAYQNERQTDEVSIAFLARAPHKFKEHLESESVVTRRETLGTMSRWLVAHPKNKVSQIQAGAVPVLTMLLSDEDISIREGSSLVLSQLASVHDGVQDMLDTGTVTHLLTALRDRESSKTRFNAHACLHLVGESPDGSLAIVQAGGTSQLVEECRQRASPESLRSLALCLRNRPGLEEALRCGANNAMVSCLQQNQNSPAILQHASKNIASLTLEMGAKDEAIAEGAVPILTELVKHGDWPVRSAATCALMSLTLAVEGKKQVCQTHKSNTIICFFGEPLTPPAAHTGIF
jgi:hypothetical protein